MLKTEAELKEVGQGSESWFVLKASEGRYCCYCFEGQHGLAVFASYRSADFFREFLLETALEVEEVSLDQARRIAFERKMVAVPKLSCLLVLDNIESPEVLPLIG